MRILRSACLVVVCAVSGACGSSPTSASDVTPALTTLLSEMFTGTVGAPVGGALQTAAHPFTVSTGNTPIAVTMTSAIETFADGSVLPSVTMALSIGAYANNVCTPIANATVNAQAGATAQLVGTITAGTFCVQIADVTNQLGPVQYAITVQHY